MDLSLEKSSAKAFGINWGLSENQEWLKRRANWLYKEVSKQMIETVYDCKGLFSALLQKLKNTLWNHVQTQEYKMNEDFCDYTVHKDVFESFIFRKVLQVFSGYVIQSSPIAPWTVLENIIRTFLPLNEDLQKRVPKSSLEFSYQKLRKTDLSKVRNCLVEIVNAGCGLSSRHWELIPVHEGNLVINGEEKILSHDLIDVPESFLEKLPLHNRIDLKSTSSKHFDISSDR